MKKEFFVIKAIITGKTYYYYYNEVLQKDCFVKEDDISSDSCDFEKVAYKYHNVFMFVEKLKTEYPSIIFSVELVTLNINVEVSSINNCCDGCAFENKEHVVHCEKCKTTINGTEFNKNFLKKPIDNP